MSYEIYVLGKIEFIYQVLSGVAMVSRTGVLEYAAGIVGLAYLFWSFLRNAMDSDNSPYVGRVFAWILIFFIAFASDISPKLRVTLISMNSTQIRVIDDVPWYAAFPAYITSNMFRGITSAMETAFLPATYTSAEREPSPLDALVKVYDSPLPESVNYGNVPGYDLGKTIREYMQNCYVVDQTMEGPTEPTVPASALRKARMGPELIDAIAVNFNGFTTQVYLGGSEYGETESCPDAHQRIKDALFNSTTEAEMTAYYEGLGVTPERLKKSTALIYDSFGIGPSPYNIMAGHFASTMIRDGIQKTSYATSVDLMVYQAQKKRVYERAGQQTLFMQILVPMTTAIEAFAFFIAPIMVMLAVMGDKGMSMIGKYMMLILFVNLWAFVKVFTDLYTAITVQEYYSGLINFEPFSFDYYPGLVSEAEGFLATAASLTTSIPMLAGMLLYGGVHTMMGVMKGLDSAKVNADYAAPDIASPMTNGAFTMGNSGGTYSTQGGGLIQHTNNVADNEYGNITAGQALNNSNSISNGIAEQKLNSLNQSFSQGFENATQGSEAFSSGSQQMSSENWQQMSSLQKVGALSNQIQESMKVSEQEAQQLAVAAGAGVGLGGVSIDAKTQASLSSMEGYDEAKSIAEKFQSQYGQNTSSGEAQVDSDKSGNEISSAEQSAFRELASTASSIQQVQSVKASLEQGASDIKNVGTSYNPSFANGEGYVESMSDEGFINSLNDEQAMALNSALEGENFVQKYADDVAPGTDKTYGAMTELYNDLIEGKYDKDASTLSGGEAASALETNANNRALAGSILGYIGGTMKQMGASEAGQFLGASELLNEQANRMKDLSAAIGDTTSSINAPNDNDITQGSRDVKTDAQENIAERQQESKNQVDTSKANTELNGGRAQDIVNNGGTFNREEFDRKAQDMSGDVTKAVGTLPLGGALQNASERINDLLGNDGKFGTALAIDTATRELSNAGANFASTAPGIEALMSKDSFDSFDSQSAYQAKIASDLFLGSSAFEKLSDEDADRFNTGLKNLNSYLSQEGNERVGALADMALKGEISETTGLAAAADNKKDAIDVLQTNGDFGDAGAGTTSSRQGSFLSDFDELSDKGLINSAVFGEKGDLGAGVFSAEARQNYMDRNENQKLAVSDLQQRSAEDAFAYYSANQAAVESDSANVNSNEELRKPEMNAGIVDAVGSLASNSYSSVDDLLSNDEGSIFDKINKFFGAKSDNSEMVDSAVTFSSFMRQAASEVGGTSGENLSSNLDYLAKRGEDQGVISDGGQKATSVPMNENGYFAEEGGSFELNGDTYSRLVNDSGSAEALYRNESNGNVVSQQPNAPYLANQSSLSGNVVSENGIAQSQNSNLNANNEVTGSTNAPTKDSDSGVGLAGGALAAGIVGNDEVNASPSQSDTSDLANQPSLSGNVVSENGIAQSQNSSLNANNEATGSTNAPTKDSGSGVGLAGGALAAGIVGNDEGNASPSQNVDSEGSATGSAEAPLPNDAVISPQDNAASTVGDNGIGNATPAQNEGSVSATIDSTQSTFATSPNQRSSENVPLTASTLQGSNTEIPSSNVEGGTSVSEQQGQEISEPVLGSPMKLQPTDIETHETSEGMLIPKLDTVNGVASVNGVDYKEAGTTVNDEGQTTGMVYQNENGYFTVNKSNLVAHSDLPEGFRPNQK